MDLKQLRAFLTVADTGNVTRASVQLNLVQPAVSRQLQLLEEHLGVRLFERGRHGMVLTDAGRTMVEYARRIFNEVERAQAEIRPSSQTEPGGIATVGLLASTSELLAAPLVATVRDRFPHVRLRLLVGYAGHLLQWLHDGEVDAALMYDQKHTSAFHIKTLLEEQLWVAAPAAAKLRPGRKVSLAQVARQSFILPSAPQGLRGLINQVCADHGVQLQVAAETNALEIQRQLVTQGYGWTILPHVAIAAQVASGLLSAAPLSRPGVTRRIVLAAPSARSATASVRCVVGVLLEGMRAAVADGRWPSARWLAD